MTDLISRIPEWFWILFVVHFAVLGTVAYLILLERKVAAWAQDRLGPNRVGPKGLFQPLADGLKFFLKEDYRPGNVDPVLFSLAPMIMMIVIILSVAIVPWGGVHQRTKVIDVTGAADPVAAAMRHVPAQRVGEPVIDVRRIEGQVIAPGVAEPARSEAVVTYRYAFMIADLNIGVLFALATLSLAVYGVVLGGWASNNKYSFLGGMRACANMISYEIPLGLSVITIVLMFGTLSLNEIVDKQAHYWAGFIPAWNVFTQPFVFLLFLVCIHAEANRAPFDMAEAEQELVGGYHTEYSSMRFALFFLAEYAGMITTSAICVALFFGGWHFPGLTGTIDPASPAVTDSIWIVLLRSLVFLVKTMLIIFIFMWVRWSLPRFRYDQVMILAWRALIPIALAMMLATAVAVYFFGRGRPGLWVDGRLALALLAVNVAVVVLIMLISTIYPAAPETNRRVPVAGSRFAKTAVPAGAAAGSAA
jgi:NADH-quinone oxidoreductase subunit H